MQNHTQPLELHPGGGRLQVQVASVLPRGGRRSQSSSRSACLPAESWIWDMPVLGGRRVSFTIWQLEMLSVSTGRVHCAR